MGFGHRVYKTTDPRAEILREMARQSSTPEFFALARGTEEYALAELHRRKPEQRLYTNVEFYSAAVLQLRWPRPRPLPVNLRHQPRRRMDGARAGADGRQSPDPPAVGVCWPAGADLRAGERAPVMLFC